MPSFSDSIFLFVLALLLFGPKRLPVLARELGKWVGEFRRASNEFKMQMEEELRLSEQSDRQKEIAAMQAAAPVTPPLIESSPTTSSLQEETSTPLPIATSSEMKIMPPSTGLPAPQNFAPGSSEPLSGLLNSIPATQPEEAATEIAAHAD
jgi:sec-independent protein translocase protein TatB